MEDADTPSSRSKIFLYDMKCKCGNQIDVKMAAKVACQGCRILTSMTTIMTVECAVCGEKFQIPVSSGEFIVKEDE